jgi:hypothetical protein
VLDAGRPVRLLPDRLPLLRAAGRRALAARPTTPHGADPPPEPPDPAALDTTLSAGKVEGRPPPPEAAAAVDAFAALLAIRGQIDFDDLVVRAVAALEADPQLRRRWQARFSHLCVDEFQDVDAAQLRLVRVLGAPRTTSLSLVMMISRSSHLAHTAPRSSRARWPERRRRCSSE